MGADARPGESALPRARGIVRVGFDGRHGRTRIVERFEAGAARLRSPRSHGPAADAVLVNIGGGLTGGDAFETEIAARHGADVTVTTVAAEKVYRSADGPARVATRLLLDDATLHWLPQETILCEGSVLDRRLTIEMTGAARLVATESVVLGRTAMGERAERLRLADRWDVRRDGRLVFADRLSLDPGAPARAARCGLAGGVAFGTLLIASAGAEALVAPLRDALGQAPAEIEGGASAYDGLCVVRLVGATGQRLRETLARLLPVATGKPTLPRMWHC